MAKIQVRESFAQAFGSLLANKMRTFLTLLGIIIGVLTIIAVVSIIQGLNGYVYSKMSFFGANDFAIQKFSMIGMSIKDFKEQRKRKDLTLDEADLLRRSCRSCDKVGASVSTNGTVKYKSNSVKSVEIRGVTHFDHEIGSVIELESGRHIQGEDETNSRVVCVIGADLTEKLFAGVDPIGKRLKIAGRDFQIVGTAAPKGKILGFSQDNYVRIPITTYFKVFSARESVTINVHTSSQEQMSMAEEEARTILRSWRKRSYNQPDDFSFTTSETFIDFYKKATTGIYFAMIAVSSIALLVGGIVIMNIMFVTVSERTKEIGIRMAIGARRRDILIQFLVESSVISAVGGVIGILLGYAIATIVSAATSIPSSIQPLSVVAAILMSWTVGLFFGIYPANRAAKLDPVEALRSEQ